MKRREPDTPNRRAIDKTRNECCEALQEATHGGVNTNDPIVEQLKQCPEAFKVGEILGKAFDSLKHAEDGAELGDGSPRPRARCLPPLV